MHGWIWKTRAKPPIIASPTPVRSVWRALPWGIAAAAVLAAGWTVWGRAGTGTTDLPLTHLDIGFPRDVEPGPSSALGPAITADGRAVAMIGVSDGARRAFVDASIVRRRSRCRAVARMGLCSRLTARAWRSSTARGSSPASPWRTSNGRT